MSMFTKGTYIYEYMYLYRYTHSESYSVRKHKVIILRDYTSTCFEGDVMIQACG